MQDVVHVMNVFQRDNHLMHRVLASSKTQGRGQYNSSSKINPYDNSSVVIQEKPQKQFKVDANV
ncbi:hypothetical protein SOMG_04117 [Schizosaccharomyces osmophilus]|uniref:Uncharacterized protein n=1 Tax=Schizosaccharomyces osmophilus TaxID=2545709 RepID=A0AAF0AWN0_9SCHI|nr:uncharacterized protein SOMG_04117 [Schizosaccharomyces osmophilus]WBW74911.1 hypothetical protein SOMG_04117 [Schizosaccharomyces osmophilus]